MSHRGWINVYLEVRLQYCTKNEQLSTGTAKKLLSQSFLKGPKPCLFSWEFFRKIGVDSYY